MRCVYCNSQLASIAYCPGCGADVTLLKRIGRISNLLYNRGLEKAQIRDLSGAISLLTQSLKFNKENTDARNLLGLCYYETGEVVSALCEWVISNNLNPKDNPAQGYISELQNNKNQLDSINQTIRKYNQSIEYCRQGHEDMAVMQLRKVVAQNPKLVKAQQLLALLYMKNQEYEKARRVLRKAAAVDNTNTTTLRYLSQIEEITGKRSAFGGRRRNRSGQERDESSAGAAAGSMLSYVSGNETIIQPTTFRDSSTMATFINIGLGILLGGAIIWFMAVPASRQQIQEKANEAVTDAQLKLAAGNAELQDLQDEIDGYTAQVDSANQERDVALARIDSYEDLMGAASLFVNGEQSAAVDAISAIDADHLEGNAKTLYENLMTNASAALFAQYYMDGTTAYAGRDYKTAAEQLELAVAADKDQKESNYYYALYYLGFAYFNLGDTANADRVFNDLIAKYPNQSSAISPYISSGSTAAPATDATQGEASMNQNENDYSGQSGYGTTDYGTADYGTTDYGTTDYGTTDYGTQNYGGWEDTSNTGGGDITIYNNNQGNAGYNQNDVAWTDPNTGLHYDVYGNLLG